MPESKLFYEIANLETEQKNPRTENIDIASTRDVLRMINDEDLTVASIVRKEIPNISKAVDKIVESFQSGGRLFYFGAGTSGRLGIVDAVECPPTFGTAQGMVQGIIAGGTKAVFKAQEGAEDKPENGAIEIIKRKIKPPDIICGIAASGRTPFVKGALAEARKKGIFTILIATVPKKQAIKNGMLADVMICPVVGPEVITGSTRMKSGTAQKLILNMLTTASMVRLGKTLGNVMVDLQLTNAKLKERAKRILMTLTGVDYDTAENTLKLSGGNVKTALVILLAGVDVKEAKSRLEKAGGFIKKTLKFGK
ncbi:MAG: N-acetylmuramic acid 6-phosphate etherase [Bacteroidetes bacterium]|nr:MAG: N-acetylmuramic acid 6-phosphate etherase [Bacteroidota bacterium]